MERVLGPIPEHMICRSNKGAKKYIKRGSWLRWPEGVVSRESISALTLMLLSKRHMLLSTMVHGPVYPALYIIISPFVSL
ncbi:hypothetical protein JHK82_039806 [Glycine max]|nr:hypothetical protein JHK82_039806 [Glycine max]